VSDEGALTAEPILILDHRIRKLRHVNSRSGQGPVGTTIVCTRATWEDAYDMHQQFIFFVDRETYDTVNIHSIL
jgi:hypothetical protein